MTDFEKLGAFYLGRKYDPATQKTLDETILYDSKDLTTHAVCVGMTGSGKTGLGIGLLEEAAIDGIPALVIDPKGDMGNLMLSFPQLQPSDFASWIDPGEAGRAGMTPDQYAKDVAATWKKGLGQWGQDGSRVARFREAADVAIYTPGSNAGIPLTVLRSFAAPGPELMADADALRERIQASVSGLLALLGINADPIRSREHILLSNILNRAWTAGESLDIGTLIREIQDPPFTAIGVFDLESFYPAKERFELAMSLNNLIASPGFAAWMEGEPLEIGKLLFSESGKPRIAILSIAHLSEEERMFFVTILLNEVVAWMRAQPGTSSLRALLYMDEIFGYFPPTAMPPTKQPMLTLLKQARAYGLGVVLATQNPVDLDYKGLANTGTWFLGRLQTERDKARVLDGLEGASTATGHTFDRKQMDSILSGLGKRVFLLHNVHEDQPVLFQTRWALSYLRGPMTRAQIKRLMAPHQEKLAAATHPAAKTEKAVKVPKAKDSGRPVVPPDIPEFFLPRTKGIPKGGAMVYRPAILGGGRLHYVKSTSDIDFWRKVAVSTPIAEGNPAPPWDDGVISEELPELVSEPEDGARFGALPNLFLRPKNYTVWKKGLANHLYRNEALITWRCKALKESSVPGETEGEFRGRLAHSARELRDMGVEKLRKKYTPKLASLEERIRKAEARVERERSQYGQRKMQTAVSIGTTLLGALFGRRAVSTGTIGRAATSMRSAGRAAKDKEDIGRAQQDVLALQERLEELEQQFEADLEKVKEKYEPGALDLEKVVIRPRKSDIGIDTFALTWTPWTVDATGIAEKAW